MLTRVIKTTLILPPSSYLHPIHSLLPVPSTYPLNIYPTSLTPSPVFLAYTFTPPCAIKPSFPSKVVYKGCADSQNWPSLDLSYVGCRHQAYGAWRQAGQASGGATLWCFCKGHLCNDKHSMTSTSDGFAMSLFLEYFKVEVVDNRMNLFLIDFIIDI